MFLNKTQFKKWIKTAYNNRYLKIGMVYDGLVLSNGYWITWTDENYIPNWLKAAIMEYTGELPENGKLFRAAKGEPVQYEIEINEYFNLPRKFMECTVAFKETPVIHGIYRLLQCTHTQEIIGIPEDIYSILDYKELEEESRPSGPSAADVYGDILMWKNETSALAICKSKIKQDEVVQKLGTIDFSKGE